MFYVLTSRYTLTYWFGCLSLTPSPLHMRKYSLMLGALGGAVAGYLFSNEKLREELVAAKNPEQAGKILAKHLSVDGKKLGGEVQSLVKSPAFKDNVSKARTYAKTQFTKAKKEMQELVKKAGAKRHAKKAVKHAKKAVKDAA